MAILTVRVLGDPILRTKASPVELFDDALVRLSEDMHETMDAAPGVGLAAPQVGVPKRLFVYNSGGPDGDGERGTLVNPEIVWYSDETTEMEEGCLSIPGQYFPVTRPASIRVRAVDLGGRPLERPADGYLARIFQHEIDHLDGILFIDHLAPEVRRDAMKALRDQDFGMAPPRKPREDL